MKNAQSTIGRLLLTVCALVFVFPFAVAFATLEPAEQSLASPSQDQKVRSAKRAPKLSVRWDCGDCEPILNSEAFIKAYYDAVMKQKGFESGSSEQAELVITEYSRPGMFETMMFGVLAGKPKLITKLSYQGQEFIFDDYPTAVFKSAREMCEAIAQRAIAKLSAEPSLLEKPAILGPK